MTATKQWQKTNKRIAEAGLAGFLVLLLLLLLFGRLLSIRNVLLLASLGGLFIWYIVGSMRATAAEGTERVYLLEQRLGQQVVAGVLGHKGLPYEQQNSGNRISFVLVDQGEPLVVDVEPFRIGQPGLLGPAPATACRVRIKPVNAETQPLVESLQAKIDEAFLPRGLPPATA
ncbi:MAG: hypothetical protein KDE04_18375 [Anaerolineales bacterium]|nr:hypothetical protein [Anaerolineales bacterium]